MPDNPPDLMITPPKYLGAALTLSLCTLLGDQAMAQATTSTSESPTPPTGPRARQGSKGLLVPYHGIISAVDKNAKTFTIEGKRESHVLKMIDGTSITKG